MPAGWPGPASPEGRVRNLPCYRPRILLASTNDFVNSGGGATTTFQVALPRARRGDLMVAAGYSSASSAVTVDQGWTIAANVTSGDSPFLAYKVHTGFGPAGIGEVAPTFTAGSGRWAVAMFAWRVDSPLWYPDLWDAIVGTTATSGSTGITTLTGAANLDVQPGDLLMLVTVSDDDLTTWTRPADAVTAPDVLWAAASVEAPAAHYNSGNNAAPLGNDSACDVTYRMAHWSSGASTGAPVMNSTTGIVRPHCVWARIRSKRIHRDFLRGRPAGQPRIGRHFP